MGLAGLLCAPVALVAVSHSAAREAPPAAAPAGLIGEWRLNDKESEDPRVKFARPREPRPGEAERPDATGPGPAGWPRRSGSGDLDRSDARPAGAGKRALSGPREFLDSPRTLTIATSGPELTLGYTFSDGQRATVRLRPDGSEQKQSGVTRVARWEGPSLVVESAPEAGGELSARYNPMPRRRQLEVYSRYVDKDGELMTLRRVFDAALAAQPPSEPPAAGPPPEPPTAGSLPELLSAEPTPEPAAAETTSRENPAGSLRPAHEPKEGPRPGPSNDVPTFGVTTALVYVRFHVDRKGGSPDPLDKDQIRVLEDGRPQAIALLETPSTRERTIPPEVVLVLDVSGSVMEPGLLDETLVRDVFFASLSEQTTVGLCAFGGELRCLVPPTRDLRALLDGFEQALLFSRQTRNQGTRLYASVAEICNRASEGPRAQRALVIFSDGLDNRGGKVEQAVRAAAETDMRVYAVKLSQAFRDAPAGLRAGGFGRAPNRALYDYKKFDLDRLASETGGRAYEPATLDKKSLTGILRSIATEIRTEYVVGYQPEGPATGRKRRVKVELVDKSLGSIRGGERALVR